MRKLFLTAFVLGAALVFASTGLALEKTSQLAIDGDGDDWAAGTTCTVSYYNICTGWLWVWSGWSPLDQMGVCFDTCGDNCELLSTRWRWWSGNPAGYGFTGTISVQSVDASCCPNGVLAQTTWLAYSGWNQNTWNVAVPNQFAVMGTLGPGIGIASPGAVASDHPAAGPTGPQACDTCYPATRVNHSFYWGTANTLLCPGSPFNDGICDAELWMTASLSCVISVEETSWGAVKNLYR